MKKLSLFIFLALLLVFSSSCSKAHPPSVETTVREEITTVPQTDTVTSPVTESPETEAPETEAPQTETQEPQTEETEPPAPPEPAGTVVAYGTPEIDGYTDEIYLNSFCYIEDPLVNLNFCPTGIEGAKQYMPYTSACAYYLYDESYLYISVTVHDETICSQGEEWRNSTEWPWNDDGVEIYLWFSDENCFAIHSDAANIRSVIDTHIYGENHSSSLIYEDTPREDWCAVIDEEAKEYTVEIRVPLPQGFVPGDKIGTLIEIDDRWAIGPGTENMVGALFAYPRFPGNENFLVPIGSVPTE